MSLPLNPFAIVSWSWRALRGHSVTFASLFALGVLGISVLAEFRHVLSRFGAPWYVWLFVPLFVVSFLARKEAEWLPAIETRRRWARGLFFGSILLAIVIAKFGAWRHARVRPTVEPTAAVAR